MALGFTSHYSQSEQPFGSLILGSSENETSGSVAYSSDNDCSYSLISQNMGDSYSFSVSVDIDYSQYSSFDVSSCSAETAGSVAYSGSFSSGGETYSCSSGGASFSSGCSSGGCSTSFTC